LGAHQNIVSLVGCCTLQEHKFLVIEYAPYGDLLQWLRRGRRSEGEVDQEGIKEDHALGREASLIMESPPTDTQDVIVDMALTSKNLNEDNNKDPLDQENIELLAMSSTSKGINNPAAVSLSTNTLDENGDETDSFTNQQLFSFAWQIAKGMNHLAEKDFIHRDLAARNILVGSDNRVKVSDFGLMRQVYEDVYSTKKTKKLPVKWMAPESIFYSVFTIKSDVWSYGVLLWEMATMGGVPYPTLTNSELCRRLKAGYRMERPDMCCDEV